MDLKSSPLSDFTRPGERSLFVSDTVSATHEVKLNKIVDISGDDAIGTVKYKLLLDSALDDMSEVMAAGYEKYKISDLSIKVQSGSPLGTSSGALQMCYIPDPLNGNFSTTSLGSNLTKAVRQAGSKVVRPRENVDEVLPLYGTLYTKQSGTARLWSFGTLAFVVRSVPDAADYASFVITVHCTVQFIRTAQIDYDDTVVFDTTVKSFSVGKKAVEVELNCETPFSNCTLHFKQPLQVLARVKQQQGEVTRHVRLSEVKLRNISPTKLVLEQVPDMEIIKLVDNLLLKKVSVRGSLPKR